MWYQNICSALYGFVTITTVQTLPAGAEGRQTVQWNSSDPSGCYSCTTWNMNGVQINRHSKPLQLKLIKKLCRLLYSLSLKTPDTVNDNIVGCETVTHWGYTGLSYTLITRQRSPFLETVKSVKIQNSTWKSYILLTMQYLINMHLIRNKNGNATTVTFNSNLQHLPRVHSTGSLLVLNQLLTGYPRTTNKFLNGMPTSGLQVHYLSIGWFLW